MLDGLATIGKFWTSIPWKVLTSIKPCKFIIRSFSIFYILCSIDLLPCLFPPSSLMTEVPNFDTRYPKPRTFEPYDSSKQTIGTMVANHFYGGMRRAREIAPQRSASRQCRGTWWFLTAGQREREWELVLTIKVVCNISKLFKLIKSRQDSNMLNLDPLANCLMCQQYEEWCNM